MSIDAPLNVCYENGKLQWSPVQCADGYLIHEDDQYKAFINGQDAREFFIESTGQLAVSAYIKGFVDGNACQFDTSKTDAVTKRGPTDGEILVDQNFIKLCPEYWDTEFPWGPDQTINGELQRYPDIFGFEESPHMPFVITPEQTLKIIAKREDYLGKQWISGKICYKDAIDGEFYAESRIRADSVKGGWPAFWLVNYFYDEDETEIDVMEQPGFDPLEVHHSYHYRTDGNSDYQSTKSISQTDSREWHIYSAERKTDKITYFVDGLPVHTVTENLRMQPMRLILNLAIGGWAATPDPDLNETSMEVDYVKVVSI